MSKGNSKTGSQAGTTELTINSLEGWLWDAACSIRGAVDAPKFKDYILPLIFVKRLSDVFDDEIDRLAKKFGDRETALELIAGDHSLVRFYIPPEASWSEVRKLTTKIGQRLTETVRSLTKVNPSLQGVIDIVDFNATISGQRIIEDGRLSMLIEILSRHALGLKDVEPDLLGRAYEYLLRKFAEGQGQSAGEFFTPQEVGWLIARLLRPTEGLTIYDPACGSGGLLVKSELVVKEATAQVKRPMRLYGQELNPVTYAIAKMNMIIHDMEGEIAIGDTLRNPKFLNGQKLRSFDLVAANPMWNQDGYNESFYDTDQYGRFNLGNPSASSADWGWILHILASLSDRGRAVIVLDSGAVSRGGREADIRKQIVERDWVDAVILLPENLFYNTTAPGILLCLDRKKPVERRNRIALVNASAEFEKGKPKNFISGGNAETILKAVSGGQDVEGLAKILSTDEAVRNDYNLVPSRYVNSSGGREAVPVDEAIRELRLADQQRAAADHEFETVLAQLGLGASHD